MQTADGRLEPTPSPSPSAVQAVICERVQRFSVLIKESENGSGPTALPPLFIVTAVTE